MAVLMVAATVYGVLQLVVLGWPARSVRVSTVLLAIVVGVYGSGVLGAVLEFAYTRCVASATGQPLIVVVNTASYGVDPVIEELAKVAPLLLIALNRRLRAQLGLTDFVVLGAGLGGGFGLMEAMVRYGLDAHRAMVQPFGGWTIPVSLYPPYVPGVQQVFGSWLPAPADAFQLVDGLPQVAINDHLVWSVLTALGIGWFVRHRGWHRTWAVLPVAAAITHHILTNYTVDHAYGSAETVVETFDGWLWSAPLIALAIAEVVDIRQLRHAKRATPQVLLADERLGRSGFAAFAGYAAWCVPWTTLIALRFTRIRRALLFTTTQPSVEHAVSLRRVIADIAVLIDDTNHEQAWRTPAVRAVRESTRVTGLRWPGWLALVSWVIALPSLVFLGLGSFPALSGIQAFFSSGAGPGILAGLGVSGLLLVVWRLADLLRRRHEAKSHPVGEALATFSFRIWTAVGAATAGGVLLFGGLPGAGPSGTLLSNFHLLDALDNFEIYLGFALLLLSLLVLFPPGGLALVGSGLLADAVAAEAVGGVAAVAAGTARSASAISVEGAVAAGALGAVGVVLMAAGAKGGSGASETGDGDGGRAQSPTRSVQQRAKELGYDRRIPAQKAPFNSHGQPVFSNGKNYITPDIDQHNVSGGWKMFNRRGQRIGTYDGSLNRIKD